MLVVQLVGRVGMEHTQRHEGKVPASPPCSEYISMLRPEGIYGSHGPKLVVEAEMAKHPGLESCWWKVSRQDWGPMVAREWKMGMYRSVEATTS